ncbi:MAG: hypothetical protein DRN53_05755, partial [Thermoprotei archaeon]
KFVVGTCFPYGSTTGHVGAIEVEASPILTSPFELYSCTLPTELFILHSPLSWVRVEFIFFYSYLCAYVSALEIRLTHRATALFDGGESPH